MSRFPLPSSDAHKAQSQVESEIESLHRGTPPFSFKDDAGSLLGCYAPLVYNPHIITPFFALAKAIYRDETLPGRMRELSILAVASTFDAPYVAYCHRGLGKRVGLSDDQIEDAVHGRTPKQLPEPETVAYETAKTLATARTPLDGPQFQRAEVILGRQQLAGLMHTVAGYLYVCTLINVAGYDTSANIAYK